jgi:hypothetical protein
MFKMFNFGLHFLLEIFAFVAIGYRGFNSYINTENRILFGIGLPLILAIIWGVFRVPNEPGPAIVAIPGWSRIFLEWSVFSLAIWCLANTGQSSLAWIFAFLVVANYGFMFDWVLSMIARK